MGVNDRQQSAREDKREASRKAGGGDATWRGYVNVDLSAEQKREFDDWSHTTEPWDVLEEVGCAGVVVTVKVDKGGTAFMASATQRDPLSVNAGLCVTARASTAGKALFRLFYILHLLGPSTDWSAHHPVADPDRW